MLSPVDALPFASHAVQQARLAIPAVGIPFGARPVIGLEFEQRGLPRFGRCPSFDLLAAHIAAILPTYREGSPGLTAALINLRNIRWALARRDFSP